ncbi:MAG: type I-C CRISPR-associated protein Cas7/Csd2 [Armatimonadetes bacterium]|nr:type I-C CRISPR-associated protein Cas7/Csd2 [Armatimonadota bacterium]
MKHLDQLTDPNKRYDFVILFDVTDGNPNGDPDAGNLPRIDPETMQGIVTDVCLKRKIRNYVDLVKKPGGDLDLSEENGKGYGIFVRDSGVALNTKLAAAAQAVGAAKDKKRRNEDARQEVCRRYYDVRLFGGVLAVGEYNCGQVRGPVQLTFARSVDPIIPGDISITRVAITKEGENKETEMGRKALVPYGLYLGKGFFSPMLASDTGVDAEDLRLFWTALANMFEMDRSASRGDMRLREVFVFRHDDPLGNAHAGRLFDRIRVFRKPDVKAPRRFEDYVVELAQDPPLPQGVALFRLLEE